MTFFLDLTKSNLYIYDTHTKRNHRVASDISGIQRLHWMADSRHIVLLDWVHNVLRLITIDALPSEPNPNRRPWPGQASSADNGNQRPRS